MIPKQAFEILPLEGGTYLLRVYSVSVACMGTVGLPEGRTLTSMKAYPSLNALIADLKALLTAVV